MHKLLTTDDVALAQHYLRLLEKSLHFEEQNGEEHCLIENGTVWLSTKERCFWLLYVMVSQNILRPNKR